MKHVVLAFASLLFAVSAEAAEVRSYDLVVYGGTAGGVITAVSAAREGLKVALLEPRDHVGGMVSGGLTATDFGKKAAIGGLSHEFFERVGRRYGEPIGWYFEPHVAEEVYREMLREAGVLVFFRHRLREKTGVGKKGTKVEEIRLENGAVPRGAVCGRDVRRRPHGPGGRVLHLGTRRHRAIWRVAGRRA